MAASQPPASLAPAGHSGVIVVAEGTWPQHPWLGRLESGSDMGSDGAWFTTWEDAPAPIATLDALAVEHSCGQGLWQPAVRADASSLPSRDRAQAAVGWLKPHARGSGATAQCSNRARFPSTWDPTRIRPQAQIPSVDYFTDWRTRTWQCQCSWAGTNETALVFADESHVSVACPTCGDGIATIPRHVTADQVATAASAGNAEAIALCHPDEHGNPYLGSPGRPRFLTGHEQSVPFAGGDQFFGVDAQWLIPLLRLDPHRCSEPLELLEGDSLGIAVDNDLHEDIEVTDVLGESLGELCTYDDDDCIGGRYDLYDGWIEAWAADIRWTITWIGDGPHDYTALALKKAGEGMDYWEPQPEDTLLITSPYLQASDPRHVQRVLQLACEAGVVMLNGTLIR